MKYGSSSLLFMVLYIELFDVIILCIIEIYFFKDITVVSFIIYCYFLIGQSHDNHVITYVISSSETGFDHSLINIRSFIRNQ